MLFSFLALGAMELIVLAVLFLMVVAGVGVAILVPLLTAKRPDDPRIDEIRDRLRDDY